MSKISTDWIEKNLKKMMDQIYVDARYQKPLPLKITMQGAALDKFIDILKSKSIFFPDDKGGFTFIGIPIRINNRIPFGTFAVERFSNINTLTRKL